MLGIEYLWGGPVHLETSELKVAEAFSDDGEREQPQGAETEWTRVLYTMSRRKLTKTNFTK